MIQFVKVFRIMFPALLFVGLGVATSCKKQESVKSPGSVLTAKLPIALTKNNLAGLPGAINASQVASPIHWQPWSKETAQLAKSTDRLIFGVVALPQQPKFQVVLEELGASEKAVRAIHENYVPTIIDGDASREIGLLTAELCAEIQQPLDLPLFIWMTADGNPVAWIPMAASETSAVDLFFRSHFMVSRMWADDPGYVNKNARMDNAMRQDRITERMKRNSSEDQPSVDLERSLRQLISFYDPYFRTFDEAGGLFPTGTISLLATAANHPGVNPEIRRRCLDTTRELTNDLLPSAMLDPLTGGAFSTRLASSWALPSFSQDCMAQARTAVALLDSYRATGDARALERALGIIEFAERSYLTSEGLFSVGMSQNRDVSKWLWSVEEIQNELSPEDAAWWIKATGVKATGNFPTDVDAGRKYFRRNSLAMNQSVAELAAEQNQAIEQFAPRFEAVRAKLLKAREARVKEVVRDEVSHAGASFRMVSTYAVAYAATGDDKLRLKAVELLEKSRAAFADGPRLRNFSKEAPKPLGEARAFIYGLALQASLDASAITWDSRWLVWSEDLATTAGEIFMGGGYLKECSADAEIIELPITDQVMLFDDTSVGLMSSAQHRLSQGSRALPASFTTLPSVLPRYAEARPILHTDLLQSHIARKYDASVVAGDDVSPEMVLAIQRLHPRMIHRRVAKETDEVPRGSVKLILTDSPPVVLSTPDELKAALNSENQKL